MTGISIMNSNIRDLKSKRYSIENINRDVSMLVSISNRIYTVDDRIESDIINDRDFESEYRYMDFLRNGLLIFSNDDSVKLDSMMDMKFRALIDYREDSILCDNADVFHDRNSSLNRGIRSILKSSISNSLESNDVKLKEVLDSYDKSYYRSIIVGSFLVIAFVVLFVLLLKDMVILMKSNTRTRSTIEDLFRYIKSKK
jgi:hypothetical protein